MTAILWILAAQGVLGALDVLLNHGLVSWLLIMAIGVPGWGLRDVAASWSMAARMPATAAGEAS
jgi:formate hydrogenlyase subunit 3/multisubunit Na+/H+ antiporter MnhD subunit